MASIKDYFVVDSLAKCGLAEDDYSGQKALIAQVTGLSVSEGPVD